MLKPIQQLVQMVLDRRAAKQTEQGAKDSLGKIDKGMNRLVESAKRIGAYLIAAFSVRAIGKFINDVEESRRTLIRLTGASGQLLRTLKRDTTAVFRSVPESMGEVATAVGNLNTLLHVTDEPLRVITKSALDFARANDVNVANATLTVGQLLNRYGLSADAAVPLMDRLTVAGQATGASVTELAERLLETGPTLAQLGFSLNQQIALFSEFERRGIKTTEAAAGMNRVFTNLAREGFTDGTAAFEEFVRRIKAAPSDLAAGSIAAEAFGSRAGAKMAIDIRAGVFAIDDLTEALRNADGALADTEERSRTTTDSLKTAANDLKGRLAPAVSVVAGTVRLLIRAIDGMVKGWEDSVETGIRTFYEVEQAALKAWIAIKGTFGFDTSKAEAKLRNVTQLLDDLKAEADKAGESVAKTTAPSEKVKAQFDVRQEAQGPPTKQGDAEAAAKALADEAARIRESVKTPQEVYDEEIRRLAAHLQAKRITEETYNRATVAAAQKLQDDLKKVAGDTEDPVADATTKMNQALAQNATFAELLGSSYDQAGQRVSILTTAMQDLVAAGLDPQDARLQDLAKSLRTVQREADLSAQAQEQMAGVAQTASEILNAAFGAGIGQLAAGKAKQAALLAAEQAVMGLIATLNPLTAAQAAGHYAAAAQLTGIAAGWAALAGATGGFSAPTAGGASGAPPGAPGDIGGPLSAASNPIGSELNVFFEGPGFDAVNPRVQRVVAGATQLHEERAGPNTRVRIHRTRNNP